MVKILIIDDDADHVRMTAAHLKRENHIVESAKSGDEAMSLMAVSDYDVVLLDWNLPDASGIELLKWYRTKGSGMVIMITGKGAIDDRTHGLDCGADDYLIKPFSMKELTSRIGALLRRSPTYTAAPLIAGDYQLNPGKLTVTRNGKAVKLRPREFALLELLFRHRNEVFSMEALMSRVWRAESEPTRESVRTAVKNIRKRLGDSVIETVSGSGYKFGA